MYLIRLIWRSAFESKSVHMRYSPWSQAGKTAEPIRSQWAVSNWFRRHTSYELNSSNSGLSYINDNDSDIQQDKLKEHWKLKCNVNWEPLLSTRWILVVNLRIAMIVLLSTRWIFVVNLRIVTIVLRTCWRNLIVSLLKLKNFFLERTSRLRTLSGLWVGPNSTLFLSP